MASTAFEITGSMGNIVSDTEVIFPNVLTCVAVACRVGGAFVGAHITLADRGRLSEVLRTITTRYGRVSEVYVIGPVLGAYNVNAFANLKCPIYIHDCSGGIDVRATMSGAPTFEKRTAGGGSWSPISPAQFV